MNYIGYTKGYRSFCGRVPKHWIYDVMSYDVNVGEMLRLYICSTGSLYETILKINITSYKTE